MSDRQLQRKFKHAKDFGVEGNYNSENANIFREAIEKHVSRKNNLVIKGNYRGKEITHFFDKNTGVNVIRDENNFISGWKLSGEQIKYLLKTGNIGGG